jgi:hypothetical protein
MIEGSLLLFATGGVGGGGYTVVLACHTADYRTEMSRSSTRMKLAKLNENTTQTYQYLRQR